MGHDNNKNLKFIRYKNIIDTRSNANCFYPSNITDFFKMNNYFFGKSIEQNTIDSKSLVKIVDENVIKSQQENVKNLKIYKWTKSQSKIKKINYTIDVFDRIIE